MILIDNSLFIFIHFLIIQYFVSHRVIFWEQNKITFHVASRPLTPTPESRVALWDPGLKFNIHYFTRPLEAVQSSLHGVSVFGERGAMLRVQGMALNERVQQYLRRHVAALTLLHIAKQLLDGRHLTQFNRMLVENFVADSRGNSGLMEPPRFINNPLVFSVHEGYN